MPDNKVTKKQGSLKCKRKTIKDRGKQKNKN